MPPPSPDPDNRPWAATRAALAAELGQIDGVLPGSIVRRRLRCGKQRCACKGEPPALHGPYLQWTRTVNGKTVTRILSEDELARYQPWFDNARRLKELLAKLEILSAQALEAERPPRNPQSTSRSQPRP